MSENGNARTVNLIIVNENVNVNAETLLYRYIFVFHNNSITNGAITPQKPENALETRISGFSRVLVKCGVVRDYVNLIVNEMSMECVRQQFRVFHHVLVGDPHVHRMHDLQIAPSSDLHADALRHALAVAQTGE